MPRRLPPRVCLLAALVVLLAGCGEDREGGVEQRGRTATTGAGTTEARRTGTATAPAGPAVATVDVTETEFQLDPQNPRIAKPGVVTFSVRNAGRIAHALEVEGPGGEVETDTIAPGERATLKADLSRPGTYTWYCPVGDHEARGMKGKITVAGDGTAARKSGSGDGREGAERITTGEDRPGSDKDRSGKGDGGSSEGDDDSGRGGGY